MSAAHDWCQCEHDAHPNGSTPCVCVHVPGGGPRVGVHPACGRHSPAAHGYAATRRTVALVTAWGTFRVCEPCRDAGHMQPGA